MTASADDVERGQTRTPMLFGRLRTWLVMVAVVVILCGMLFGYDQGVIAGPLARMTASFNLSTRFVVGFGVGIASVAGSLYGAKAPTLQVDLA